MTLRTSLGLVASLAFAACAPRAAQQPTSLTSAYIPSAYGDTAEAEQALHAGDYEQALWMADRAAGELPADPRARYDRALALTAMAITDPSRTDAAVNAFRAAELRFGGDLAGRSRAVYGRARALDDAGRCDDARAAYREYADMIRASDAKSAATALAYADKCTPRAPDAVDVTPVARELAGANYEDAYARASALPGGPEKDYQEGLALTGLGRTKDAVAAFDRAERALGAPQESAEQHRLRALVLFNRARALREGAQCADAARAYEDYARFVESRSPRDAHIARTYAHECPGVGWREAPGAPPKSK